ncbi:ABC transporter permease [soil metagenome]
MTFILAIPRILFATFILALGQLWANRVRALLTTLGIVIGVSSTIAIVGATSGLRQFVLKQFEDVGALRFVVFGRNPREQPGRFSPQQVVLKKREAEGMAAACPSIERLSPIKAFAAAVQFGDRIERNVSVQGQAADWHLIEGRVILEGRPFSRIDEQERRTVCIVNDRAIAELALNKDPSGQSLLIDGRRFMIVGVVETKTLPTIFGGGQPLTEVFIPFAVADAMKPEPIFGLFIQGTMRSADDYPNLEAEIRSYLRKSRHLKPDDADTFSIRAVEQAIDQINKVGFMITLAATGIVAISLIVGGVGIMNIMLASVSERTREIGLRKAVGAPPLVILTQFLVEAVVLCLAGAGIGLALGGALVFGLHYLMEGAAVPLWAVLLSVGFSAFTGIAFGMFPAIKAARLDPIEALRHE